MKKIVALMLTLMLALMLVPAVAEEEVRTITILGPVDTELWDTRENQPAWQAIEAMLAEKNLRLEIEAVSSEQYEQVMLTRCSAGLDLPDLVNISNMDTVTAVMLGQAGIFQDVKPLVEEYSNGNIASMAEKYFPNFWGSSIDPNGAAYWFPGWNVMTVNETEPFYSVMTPIIRGDWVKKLGLEMPTTMDELTDTLIAFREQDANGNGEADEVMIFTPSFEYLAPQFGLPSSHIEVDIADDVVKSPWLMKEQLVPYLEFLQKMTEAGVLDIDAFDKSYEYAAQKDQSNQVGCQMNFALTAANDANVAQYDGYYLGVVAPKDLENFYVYGAPADSLVSKFAITRDCKDIQAVIDFFDICYTMEYATNYRFGQEGIGYTISEEGYIEPVQNLGNRDMELAFKGIPAIFASGVVPGVRIEQWEAQAGTLGSDPDNNAWRKAIGDTYGTPSGAKIMVWGNGSYEIALANDEQNEVIDEIYTDLYTYMDETLIRLAIGEYSIDDLDSYVDHMIEMGLKDLIEIRQSQHDAYIGK